MKKVLHELNTIEPPRITKKDNDRPVKKLEPPLLILISGSSFSGKTMLGEFTKHHLEYETN